MTSNQTITREMTIDDILNNFPQKAERLAQEMANQGLQCVGCHAATWETLENGARGHGMAEKGIDSLIEKLNTILAQEVNDSTISFTERGAKKFLEVLSGEDKQGWGLRFEEQKAGCSGYQYTLDFAEKAASEDTTFESLGIEIYVKTEMVPRLLGSEIDFVEGLQNSGFKVSNPNVSKSCGCGTSHGYK